MSFRHTDPNIYRPSFHRHLHALAISGFYARDLDADDHEFLERVRVRGIANGTLPCIDMVAVEEFEFWQLPYTVAPDIERRVGPVQKVYETAEQRAARQAKQSIWHAKRKIREQEKAIAELELERERAAWAKANETRKIREILDDIEWRKADPANRWHRRHKVTASRHYVPQWVADANAAKLKAKRETERRLKEAKRAENRRIDAERKLQAQERRRQERRRRAEQIIAESKALLQEKEQWQKLVQAQPSPAPNSLKQQIITLLRASGHAWTRDDLLRSIGCNPQVLDNCLAEMVRLGQLRNNGA
jgi:hypothetical protein